MLAIPVHHGAKGGEHFGYTGVSGVVQELPSDI